MYYDMNNPNILYNLTKYINKQDNDNINNKINKS